MKKVFGFLARMVICGVFLVLAAYFSLTLYYRNNFAVNTWINGIYCTGKTIEQVNSELVESSGKGTVVLLGVDGAEETLEMDAAQICPDYTDALESYRRSRVTGLWMIRLQDAATLELAAKKYSWNEEKLEAAFLSLGMVRAEKEKESGARVCYDDTKGYYLDDGNVGRLDVDKAYSYLKTCLMRGETYIDLEAGGCYRDREDSPQDREQREVWRKINTFASAGIVYDMGAERIPLTYDIMCGFLVREPDRGSQLEELSQSSDSAESDQGGGDAVSGIWPKTDEQGRLLVDEAAVRNWVEQLALAYDTCGTEKQFHSTRGDIVSVKYGTYGTQIDVEAEVSYLLKTLQTTRAETENHVPVYKQQGYVRGLDDIGGTYIEVDMTMQHMYLYRDGELVLDTDVVTGDVSKRRGTPEGIYYIYAKQRDRVLTGPGYASPVKYWMPVVRGVGIHDATWRNKFGAEIYKTDGSHGCINMPLEIVSQLYDMVEVGVPVVMFY